jgi:predicted glutamine amidotransferase
MGSASAGTAPRTRPASTTASNRHGAIRTCASSQANISSPLFFTHIRGAIGSAVQQTNCHPFRHDHWLFMHNGYINEFAAIKRDLILAVDPSLYPQIQGQADTEVLFYLALTFGLEDDPPAAVEQAIGLVEAVAGRHDVPHPFQGTVATTDGESTWAFRCSSEHNSRLLFYTTDVPTLRERYPTGKSSENSRTTRG